MSTYSNKTEDAIRDEVFQKGAGTGYPDHQGTNQGRAQRQIGTGSVSIEAPYTVHVNLPGYPLDLNFDASARNKGVL